MRTITKLMHSTLIAACVAGGAAPAAQAAEPSLSSDQGSQWESPRTAEALIAALTACAESQQCSAILDQLAASCAASTACTSAVNQFLEANPDIAQKVRESAPALAFWRKTVLD